MSGVTISGTPFEALTETTNRARVQMNVPTCPFPMASVVDLDPFPIYEQVRAAGPILWDESVSGWVVTSFEVCKFIEKNDADFRHPYTVVDPEKRHNQTLLEVKGGLEAGKHNISVSQGEEHDKLHRFLMNLFSPRVVEKYRDQFIRPIINATLDQIESKGHADLAADFAAQIPPRVIMAMFAMPWQDTSLVKRVTALHDDIFQFIGSQAKEGTEAARKAVAASHEVNKILEPYLQRGKSKPGEDIISRLWVDGPAAMGTKEISPDIVLGNCRELFLGGTDTTVHALCNAIYMLLADPALMERVRSDTNPRVITTFVEEVMRLYGSVQFRFRVSNQDCEIAGVPIKKDEVLFLVHGAANRDPAKYSCPASVDLQRGNPKDHLGFHSGPRVCIGAPLARAELIDGVRLLLDRLPALRADTEAPKPVFRHFFIRSYGPLHVRFDAVTGRRGA